MTDADGAEHVAALVIASADRDRGRSSSPKPRERLSAFKVPTLWLVTADRDIVPMSPTGKVDKAALQALLSEQLRRIRMTHDEGASTAS